MLIAERFSRVAEGPASAASGKSSTHRWRASQLFVAQRKQDRHLHNRSGIASRGEGIERKQWKRLSMR